ncbi:MAG TPA: hypothetical protein VML19_28590 [Verrucomicrobiae bacterium]|nr:hypothetical protein [Verrucomicrobiae bacterium]
MDKGSRTSPAISPWLQIAAPSVADVIFLALLCTLVFSSLSIRLLGDAGIGWHVRTGQIIIASHQVPHVDPFSSTMAGKTWFAWEWLYDVAVGEFDSAMGLNGVVWFNALVIAFVFAGLFQWMVWRGVNVLAAVPLTLIAIGASMIHFLARPHVVSWLFTLAWFAILDTSERRCFRGSPRRNRWLWMLPLSMLVWVNMHGGFVVGFVLLGIFWLGACWTWWRTEQGRIEDAVLKIAAGARARELFWIGVVCAAASLVNPYGWKLHRHVIAYLSNRFLMNHIQEFQSPNFHGWAERCFLVLLLITAAAQALRGRRLRTSQLAVILFSIYSGLYAARNIPVASVLLVMIVGPLIAEPVICSGPSSGFFGRMSAVQSSLRGHIWVVIAIVFTLSVAAHRGRLGSAEIMDAHFDSTRMPVAAVDYLDQHDLNGPVLSTDFWGGYLIYRLYPRKQVVVDDRHDLYGERLFKSYLKMYRGEQDWQEFLNEHKTGCLLFPRDAAITNLLLENPEWQPVYKDEVALIFVRSAVR